MKYGINIQYFSRVIGMEKAAELIAKAGFEYLDYTPSVRDDDWEIQMKNDVKIFEAYGLKVHQTHAPFNRYGTYKDNHKLCMDRAMEATALLGAKYIATHGDEFDFDKYEFSFERALDYNYNMFLPYVENSKKRGYKLAFETVFQDGYRNWATRFCTNPDDLKKLILSFNSENAVCCWDFGHAHVAFPKEHAEKIREFGSLIECTHVHDNAGNDSHQMPMTGDIKWDEIIPALKSTGYKGIMSIEYAHGRPPLLMSEEFIKLTRTSAEYIWSL